MAEKSKFTVKNDPADNVVNREVFESFDIVIWYPNGNTEECRTRPLSRKQLNEFLSQFDNRDVDVIEYDLGDTWILFGEEEELPVTSLYIFKIPGLRVSVEPVEEHGKVVTSDGKAKGGRPSDQER